MLGFVDYRNLNGTEKAAILMIALGDKLAPRLLARMNRNDAQRIATAIAAIQTVDSTVVEQLMDEFASRAGVAPVQPPPGRALVSPALPDAPHRTNFSA